MAVLTDRVQHLMEYPAKIQLEEGVGPGITNIDLFESNSIAFWIEFEVGVASIPSTL